MAAAEPNTNELRVLDVLKADPETGGILFQGRRMLVIDAVGMALLRRELIETLGAERARALLTRFGFHFGFRDAQAARELREWTSDAEWWTAGPMLRSLEGMGRVVPRTLTFEKEEGLFYAELVVSHGFESDAGGCWMFAGIASGHASACFGRHVYFIERECRSAGAGQCLLVGKTADEWGEQAEEMRAMLRGESVERVLDAMKGEIESLRAQVRRGCTFTEIIGHSKEMARVKELACDVAATETTVLIEGESGTGKELLARAIHGNSPRAKGPFVAVNCAALPETLLESELFGHEKGAFTGADRARPGRFQLASGGTLLLDEIGDMSLPVQAKVLRALQEKEVERVGGTKPEPVDVRIIAATHRSTAEMVEAGTFRRDLFYRISVFPIRIPPLRERLDDILPLAHHFAGKFGRTIAGAPVELTAAAREALRARPWPGNVRELQNTIERAVILSRGAPIEPRHLDGPAGPGPAPAFRLPPGGIVLDAVERDLLRQALEAAGGNKTKAAELLGITRSALRYRIG